MNATIYYHIRHEEKKPQIRIREKPPTSKSDTAYYELMVGDVVFFCDDVLCNQLLRVLASRPDLPKSDEEIDAEREANATSTPGAGDFELPGAPMAHQLNTGGSDVEF